jgi:dTDP-4-amino-4,6-dideoxygalactose transaminase
MLTRSDSQTAAAPDASTEPLPHIEPLFPFLDLRAQFSEIKDEIMAALSRVMDSQQFILGQEVKAFEDEVADRVGARAAVGLASGSDAILLSLMALGIGPGDEVITSPFTFVASAGSIARMGARPVFVDIDPDTFNLDPTLIEPAISSRTRAVLPIHLFGLPADLDPILRVARARDLAVIEDAAQAIGAGYRGKQVGSLGSTGCFSFYPSKNLGGAGDGGLVTTNEPELASRLRILRDHGSRQRYHYDVLGTNSRLDALQAAVLRVKLHHLEKWTQARRQKAERYRMLFAELGPDKRLSLHVKVPAAPADCYHVYYQFTLRTRQRDRLREFLRCRGIPTEIYYPLPLHLQTAFGYLRYRVGQFPESEAASREVLSLPIYPELKEEHQATIVRAIADFYSATR